MFTARLKIALALPSSDKTSPRATPHEAAPGSSLPRRNACYISQRSSSLLLISASRWITTPRRLSEDHVPLFSFSSFRLRRPLRACVEKGLFFYNPPLGAVFRRGPSFLVMHAIDSHISLEGPGGFFPPVKCARLLPRNHFRPRALAVSRERSPDEVSSRLAAPEGRFERSVLSQILSFEGDPSF